MEPKPNEEMMLIVPIRCCEFRDLARGALSALAAKYRSEECPAPRAPAVGPQDAQAGAFSDIATEDWDLLFSAVLTRLGSMLADANTLAAVGTGDAQTSRARTDIQECVEALDQLRMTMTHELARQRQPDHRGLAAAQPAPARTRPPPVIAPVSDRHVGRSPFA